MKRWPFLLTAALVAAAAATGARSAQAATTFCVGAKPGCFATIQAAVDAAQDGDTISIAAGTFAGGVTIDVSVDLIGAGPNKTTIQGGGPVLTIGAELAATEPTVSIKGVTITGGFNDSHPDTIVSQGGGVSIPQGAGLTTGATVTIADSVITGNTVAPREALPPGGGFCPGPLACAFASGGGIDNHGALTVTNTQVSNNLSGGAASLTLGANGGGIENAGPGTLRLTNSFLTGNRAIVAAPNGAFTNGGGIQNNGAATIEDSIVSGNSINAGNVAGEGEIDAFGGGIDDEGSLVLKNSAVEHNRVNGRLSSGGFVLALGGALFVGGTATIGNSRLAGNAVDAAAPTGSALAGGGGANIVDGAEMTASDTQIARNTITAAAASGPTVVGGAVANLGSLRLERALVTDNRGAATGPGGVAQGGGIWNLNPFGGPAPQLTLTDSAVTANRLSASQGDAQGGGLFTQSPVTLTRTVIAGNKPDQCFGC